nr:MAG TPA: hypothetical protein [Caudoviricetes sp.]
MSFLLNSICLLPIESIFDVVDSSLVLLLKIYLKS